MHDNLSKLASDVKTAADLAKKFESAAAALEVSLIQQEQDNKLIGSQVANPSLPDWGTLSTKQLTVPFISCRILIIL